MSNKVIKAKKELKFEDFGLDIRKNFLEAPMCPCGCGSKCVVTLKSNEELEQFCGEVLFDHDCDLCCVVAIKKNGNFLMAIKADPLEEYLQMYWCDGKKNMRAIKRYIKEVIGESNLPFHCYGLLVETENGSYKVVED